MRAVRCAAASAGAVQEGFSCDAFSVTSAIIGYSRRVLANDGVGYMAPIATNRAIVLMASTVSTSIMRIWPVSRSIAP